MDPRARRRQKEGLEIQETSFLSQLEATGHTLQGRQTKTGRKLSKKHTHTQEETKTQAQIVQTTRQGRGKGRGLNRLKGSKVRRHR